MRIALMPYGSLAPLAIVYSDEHAELLREVLEKFTHYRLALVYDYDADLTTEYDIGYEDGVRER